MYITISLLVLGSSTSVKLVSELLPVGLEPVVKNLVRGVKGYRVRLSPFCDYLTKALAYSAIQFLRTNGQVPTGED